MAAGKQKEIAFDKAVPEVTKLLGIENLDTYSIKDKLGEFSDPGEG
jgi:hypothetical protein